MAGAWASAIATSAHATTRTSSAKVPNSLRRRIGMVEHLKRHNGGCEGRAQHYMVRPLATSDRSSRPLMTAQISNPHACAIRLWLYAVAALVLAIVLVGGATRLTESGLSITEWQPVMGALPPLSDAQWQAEFQKYQAIPQYRELNAGMSLAAFKNIFWWEWTHRLV